MNENVINQGLYYLDWLLDHKAEFQQLVSKQLGNEEAASIEWSNPRLCCIAGDFTKYDEHAVQQISRNIELLRYRKYGDGLLLLELVNSPMAEVAADPEKIRRGAAQQSKGFEAYLAQSPERLKDRFESLKAFVTALGDDVQVKQLKYYMAFTRLGNFACVEVRPQNEEILAYLKVDPTSVPLEPEFTRDVREIGHYGTGNLEVRIKSDADLEKAKPLILRSYEES